jgi:hypothetical protein
MKPARLGARAAWMVIPASSGDSSSVSASAMMPPPPIAGA